MINTVRKLLIVVTFFLSVSSISTFVFAQGTAEPSITKEQRNLSAGGNFSSLPVSYVAGDILEFRIKYSSPVGAFPFSVTMEDHFPFGFELYPPSVLFVQAPFPVLDRCFEGAVAVPGYTSSVTDCYWQPFVITGGTSFLFSYTGVMTDSSVPISGFYTNKAELYLDGGELISEATVVQNSIPSEGCFIDTDPQSGPYFFGIPYTVVCDLFGPLINPQIILYNSLSSEIHIFSGSDLSYSSGGSFGNLVSLVGYPFVGQSAGTFRTSCVNNGVTMCQQTDLRNFAHPGSCSVSFDPSSTVPGSGYTLNIVVTGAVEEPIYERVTFSGGMYSIQTGTIDVSSVNGNAIYSIPFTTNPGLTGWSTFDISGTGLSNGQGFSCGESVFIDFPLFENSLSVTKYQRNLTTGIPSGGLYTTGLLTYTTGDVIEFYVEIENLTALPVDNVGFIDYYPYGFCSFTGDTHLFDDAFGYMSGSSSLCLINGFNRGFDLPAFGVTGFTISGQMFSTEYQPYSNQVKVYDIDELCYDPFSVPSLSSNFYTGFIDYSTYQYWSGLYDAFGCYQSIAQVFQVPETFSMSSLSLQKFQLVASDASFTQNCQYPSCAYTSGQLFLDTQNFMSYRIDVLNDGLGVASNLILEDRLPLGFVPLAPYPSGCVVSQIALSLDQYSLVCNRLSLPGGGAAAIGSLWSIVVTGTLSQGTGISGFTNVASVSSTNDSLCTVSSPCFSSVDALLLSEPQLQITKTFVQQSAQPGDIVRFTLEYVNLGQQTGQSVLIQDVLPAGLTYVFSTGDFDLYIPNHQSREIGDVGPGAGGVISIDVQIGQNVAVGNIINTATIASLGVVEDGSSDHIEVIYSLPLDIVKSTNVSQLFPGDIFSYSLRFVNQSDQDLSVYEIRDILPLTLNYISGSTDILGFTGTQYDPLIVNGVLVWRCGVNLPIMLCPLGTGIVGEILFDVEVR